MSIIEKLSISGIRSFGADADNEQKIIFTSPLTLILGANGCGKTTIIECLKYSLTGEMPPGTEKGQSFVHDPKLSNLTESFGRIRLKVRGIKGNSVTITRSMKIAHSKKKTTFTTMDSTMHYEKDGKSYSISKRCVDVNNEMSETMGVSKAIINNVIFCHQEDSNWPLEESQKLKIKFDAIFGTTEYNKAIDKIIKIRKNYVIQQNLNQSELKSLFHYKTETESKILELQESQKKYQKLMDEIDSLEKELTPVCERLAKIQKIEYDIGKLQSKKVELSTKLQNCQKQQETLRGKIKTIFDGSISMLESEIHSFKESVELKEKKLIGKERQLTTLKLQEKKLQSILNDLENKRVKLSYQRQQEQELIAERSDKIKKLCTQLKININAEFDSCSDEIYDDVITNIENAFKTEDKLFTDLAKSHDKIDLEMQTTIDNLREKRATIENEIISKKKQINELRKEQCDLEKQIDSVEKSAELLKNLSKDIDESNKKYDEFSKNSQIDLLKRAITDKRINRDKLQENLDKVDEKLIYLNSFSKISAEISIKENQYELRNNEVRRVKNKHSDNLKRLFYNKKIESNYKRNIQTFYENKQKEIKDLNQTINKNQLKVNEYQIMRKNQKDNLNSMENELKDSEEKIYDKCRSLPYTEMVEKLKEKISKTQLTHGANKSSEVLYKHYINKIENEPCCPLCHKDMDSNEINDLSTELLDEIQQLPEKIEQSEKSLKLDQKKYELLLTLQPVTERIEFLKLDIPKLKEKLKETEDNLNAALNDVETFQMALLEPNANLMLANSLLGDMSLLDEAIKDVMKLEDELKKLKLKLPNDDTISTATIEDLQIEKSTINGELKNTRNDINNLEIKIQNDTEKLNTLREIRIALKDKQIKLQEGVQALSSLKQRQKQITIQINAITSENSNFESKLQPLKTELLIASDNKEKTKNENRKKLDVAQKNLSTLKNINVEIQKCTKQINSFAELNIADEIETLKASLIKYKEELQTKNTEDQSVTKEIDNIKQDLSNQALNERDLIDNLDLKKVLIEEEDFQKKYDLLIKDIGDMDYRTVSKEKCILLDRENEIRSKKNIISGVISELENQIKNAKKVLNQDMYKNSIKNYRKAFYEVEVMKKIIKDLGSYRIALEWALIKFHSEKMQKINQLIREYWRAIYRGNDIDFIEIKTDEVKAETDKKRNYKYRVVQSKRGVEIDFRGRCSAGQKVLASLIIRMALAETFSSNCGVLALDEPTTNLDRVNILSLCEVLQRVIEERQTQSNFMLIVITHDEEFIKTLGTIESYYKLQRNHNGKSVIQKVRP